MNYVTIYNAKTNTTHRNSDKILWLWSQVAFILISASVGEYCLLLRNSEYLKSSPSLQAIAFTGAILYIGIVGLYIVFTISVDCNGDTYFNCFNTVNTFSDRHGPAIIKLQPRDSRFLSWIVLISLGSVFLPSLLVISGTLFFELDPYSFILRDIFHHPPNNALIFLIKCLPLCYASHIGWFGLLSVMVTALIQLHYAFSMIKK